MELYFGHKGYIYTCNILNPEQIQTKLNDNINQYIKSINEINKYKCIYALLILMFIEKENTNINTIINNIDIILSKIKKYAFTCQKKHQKSTFKNTLRNQKNV